MHTELILSNFSQTSRNFRLCFHV